MAKCRNCHANLKEVIFLGKMPLANAFLGDLKKEKEKKYDLTVCFCPKCYLVQLKKIISPEKLFSHYIYFSSTSDTFLDYCRKAAGYFIKRFKLNKKSQIFEIASNDGSFLKFFQKKGIKVLGIDPAKNIALLANKNGIKTIPDFFCYRVACNLQKKNQPDIIYGANVLAHVPSINDFVRGLKTLLPKNSTAIFEFPYLAGLLENKFDIIYHEHVFYYSLIALINIFSKVKMEIYDAEKTAMQGGSLRIYVCHQHAFTKTNRVRRLRIQEFVANFQKIDAFYQIEKNIIRQKKQLTACLSKLKKEGKTIVAYGAPAKGNTLLNYFSIGSKILEFVVDKAKSKQGLFTPGTHLSIRPVQEVYKFKPDYLLILCWNIYPEIVADLKKHGFRGKFIIPAPSLKII